MVKKLRELDLTNPEDMKEFKERVRKSNINEGLFDARNSEFDETGLASGSMDIIDKTDAELFPDEIEEYTPEERRKTFKVHENKDKEDKPD